MSVCKFCGGEIDFRIVDGQKRPIHLSGGCYGSPGSNGARVDRFDGARDFCGPTRCPECSQRVFFIRHNGGSVWMNGPLGWPWQKHGCMDVASPWIVRRTRAENIESESHANGALVATVVTHRYWKDCLVLLKFPQGVLEPWIVRNPADTKEFTGSLVVVNRVEKTLEHEKHGTLTITEGPTPCPVCGESVVFTELDNHVAKTHQDFVSEAEMHRHLARHKRK